MQILLLKKYTGSVRKKYWENTSYLEIGSTSQEIYKQFWILFLAKKVVTGEIINKAKMGGS